ncbi:M48 family metallopeptidase [Streptomyces sp. NPDC004647]|uniref:M48 family metallopeptidase n=1 Tax=Streptomyces sp. NPDC004647 TaxID=3154671 RepID=UPI0033B3363A
MTATAAPRVRFPGIASQAYEHPAAQAALTAVHKAKGVDELLKKLTGSTTEAALRMHHLASAVKVGGTQFRGLHTLMSEAATTLDVAEPPELYVSRGAGFNAFTIGFRRPFIVLGCELVDSLHEEEIRFVVGHELGHAVSGHALYQSLAWILARVGVSGLSSVPGAVLIAKGIELGLYDWARKSELSGDRAGLLVGQDVEVAVRTLMKLAGGTQTEEMSAEAFLEQAAEFELSTTGMKNRVIKWMMPSSTHPLLVVRAAELDRWVRGGEYGRIVHDGDYPMRGEPTSVPSQLIRTFDNVRHTRKLKRDDAGQLTRDGFVRRSFGRDPE